MKVLAILTLTSLLGVFAAPVPDIDSSIQEVSNSETNNNALANPEPNPSPTPSSERVEKRAKTENWKTAPDFIKKISDQQYLLIYLNQQYRKFRVKFRLLKGGGVDVLYPPRCQVRVDWNDVAEVLGNKPPELTRETTPPSPPSP